MGDRLIMGYWDCPFCGNKGVRGNVMNCPACGRARGDVRFYMKNAEEGATLTEEQLGSMEYLSEDEAKDFSDKPDWYCSFCNSLNRDNASFCSNCGATREDSEKNYFDVKRQLKEKEEAEKAALRQQQPQQPVKRSKKWLLILAAVVLAIVGFTAFMNGQQKTDAQVADLYWARSVPIEKYVQFSESDWSMPAGAEEVRQAREIHHYQQVPDHVETVQVPRTRQEFDHNETRYRTVDNGNGSFTQEAYTVPVYRTVTYYEDVKKQIYRDEPVYATKYYYTIWRWTQDRVARSEGHDRNTYWPETDLQENEREGAQRGELYVFTVKNAKGETSSWRVKEDIWMTLENGKGVTIRMKRSGAEPCLMDGETVLAELEPYSRY